MSSVSLPKFMVNLGKIANENSKRFIILANQNKINKKNREQERKIQQKAYNDLKREVEKT